MIHTTKSQRTRMCLKGFVWLFVLLLPCSSFLIDKGLSTEPRMISSYGAIGSQFPSGKKVAMLFTTPMTYWNGTVNEKGQRIADHKPHIVVYHATWDGGGYMEQPTPENLGHNFCTPELMAAWEGIEVWLYLSVHARNLYGDAPLSLVKWQIEYLKSIVPGAVGIFFDECAMDGSSECEAYLQEIIDHAHAQGLRAMCNASANAGSYAYVCLELGAEAALVETADKVVSVSQQDWFSNFDESHYFGCQDTDGQSLDDALTHARTIWSVGFGLAQCGWHTSVIPDWYEEYIDILMEEAKDY